MIDRVAETKFLGVIIDDELSWKPHIANLTTKLRSCVGRICRIRDYVPQDLCAEIYRTLYESHLIYGISVWGGVSKNRLEPLFLTQKKCLRILFGDRQAYKDKFKTCARARPFGAQKLGAEFYRKENSKPLFLSNKLLTVHNLYKYHCTMETYKILKFRTPISLYSLFQLSNRKETLLCLTRTLTNYTMNSSKLWNTYRELLKVYEFTVSVSVLKGRLKDHLISIQKLHSTTEWYETDFT